MKKFQKGFMLFETIVVSTFILGTIIFMYIQFSNIKRSFDASFKYNTINGLYYAKNLSNFLTDDGVNDIITELNKSENGYVDITNCLYSNGSLCNKIINNIGAKKVLFTLSDITKLKQSAKEAGFFDDEFKKFIELQPNVSKNEKNRLIIEYNDGTFASVSVGKDETTLYEATNLIKNGDGEGDISLWSVSSGGTISKDSKGYLSANSIKFSSATNQNVEIVQVVSIKEDHIYYASENVFFETNLENNTDVIFGLYKVGGTTSDYPEYGNINLSDITSERWIQNSFTFLVTASADYYFRGISSSVPIDVYLDNMILVDLTETFGVGNEPSKAWCDEYLKYFDGKKNISK